MTRPLFRVLNPAGGLVVDSNTLGLNYLGTATPVSLTQPSGSATTSAGRSAGFSTYTFAWANPIVPFVLLDAKRVRIQAMTQSSGVWTITLYCGTSPQDSNGFDTQDWTTVYVFGVLSSATGVGLKIYNDSGQLTHAFTDTDGVPLLLRAGLQDSSTGFAGPFSLPALTTPAISGFPGGAAFTAVSIGSAGNYQMTVRGYAWSFTNTPAGLYRVPITLRKFVADGPITTSLLGPSNAFLIDAAGL